MDLKIGCIAVKTGVPMTGEADQIAKKVAKQKPLFPI